MLFQLDTCLTKIDLHEFEKRVITGLSDDSDEVKVISHMMLFRLSQVAPTSIDQLDHRWCVFESAVLVVHCEIRGNGLSKCCRISDRIRKEGICGDGLPVAC